MRKREWVIRYYTRDGGIDGEAEFCGTREEAEEMGRWLMERKWWAVRWEVYEIEGVGSE